MPNYTNQKESPFPNQLKGGNVVKLTIPPEFQVGCKTFRIRISNKILREIDCKGQLVDKEDLVRLASRSPSSMFETLIHEIMHEIIYMCALNNSPSIDETSTAPMACFLAQALMSLGIEPNFDKIPNEEQ